MEDGRLEELEREGMRLAEAGDIEAAINIFTKVLQPLK